jgi:hypothetical protein
VLRDIDPPPSPYIPREFGAFDVFAGYMVLDAWIANRDRHDDNWAILLPPPDSADNLRLSDSYDQSSSLGYNVRESECTARLSQRNGVEQWARKGTAWRFEYVANAAALDQGTKDAAKQNKGGKEDESGDGHHVSSLGRIRLWRCCLPG